MSIIVVVVVDYLFVAARPKQAQWRCRSAAVAAIIKTTEQQ